MTASEVVVWHGEAELRSLLVPLADLRPHPDNPRVGDVQAIRASLERFGQQRPVLCTEDGLVVAGNHTYLAAVDAGWTHIAALRTALTGADADAYLLADNRTSQLGGYDDARLAAMLARFDTPDALTGLGYSAADVRDIIAAAQWRAAPVAPDTQAPPLPDTAASQPGEVYQLGAHRLMCGDATNPDHVAQLLDSAEPFLLVTDPPYGIGLEMRWRDRVGLHGARARAPGYQRLPGHANTGIDGDDRIDWADAYQLVPSLSIAYVWHAAWHVCEVAAGLERIGFQISQHIVWAKDTFSIGRSHYQWIHETCLYARRTGAPRWRGPRNLATVWNARSPKRLGADEDTVDHPTQKPALLYLRPIECHLRPGDALYDPFAGSGTALVAAEQRDVVCYAMELDPRYVDVIRKRYAEFTNRPELAP